LPSTPTTLYAGTDDGVFSHGAASSYALTTAASPAEGGSIVRSSKAASYTTGTVVTPTASYTFTGWSGGATGIANPTTVTMDADKAVTATFTSSTTASGGIDGDGTVTTFGVLLAANTVVGFGTPLTRAAFVAADLNHNGIINVLDVLLMARLAAGLPV
jgi:uncharacterized repeat protein (TIGR02543 family)